MLPADDLIESKSYSKLADYLRQLVDKEYNIHSSLSENNEWIRDVSDAKLEPTANNVVDKNNMLLRCLARMRGIDFALDKKGSQALREKLKTTFSTLRTNAEQTTDYAILEEAFNTDLLKVLHEANLTKGCETSHDAEKLLFHYRNLSSLLDPARTMITLTYDWEQGVLQRETHYPVTRKTEKQREKGVLEAVKRYPSKSQMNGHFSQKEAMQEADSLFADLLVDDTRMLPAQARKTHIAGVKNAFIVKNELIFVESGTELKLSDALELNAEKQDILWLGRTGSPVYVGKGETDERILEHTKENIEQIRMCAKDYMDIDPLTIHLTCLNTDFPNEKQTVIIDNLKKAFSDNNEILTNVPTNDLGLLYDVKRYTPKKRKADTLRGRDVANKKARIDFAREQVLHAAQANQLSLVNCASGQDRTGTEIERTVEQWMQKRISDAGKTVQGLLARRAAGRNAVEIASHMVPGSPGMKKDSKADDLFKDESLDYSNYFYLDSANTNKKNMVNDVQFLKTASHAAIAEYRTLLKALEGKPDFQKVLVQIKLIAGDLKTIDANTLGELSAVLSICNRAAQDPSKYAPELIEASMHVSGKPSSGWKMLGGFLFIASMAILFLAAIALSIPTVGASLLLSAAVWACFGVGVGAMLGGAFAADKGSRHGLSHSLFKAGKQLQKQKLDDDVAEQIPVLGGDL